MDELEAAFAVERDTARSLEQLEAIIEHGLQTFYEVGDAL